MTARDSNRMWGAGRCAQLGKLDRKDGLVCPVCPDVCGAVRVRSWTLKAEAGEELDQAESVVMDALCHLGCNVPVDPYDADDCASVATEAVRSLRASGLLPQRKPWLTADHWLLIVCMFVLGAFLAYTYTVGQNSRCDRLAAAGDPAAATYCPEETP